MLGKSSKSIIISAVIVAALIGGAYAYTNGVHVPKKVIPNCIEFRTGLVRVKINYPDTLTTTPGDSDISFYRRNNSDKGPIFLLIMHSPFYEPLGDLLNRDQGGDNYSTSTFNGYQAGEYKLVSQGKYAFDYLVPVENRVLQFDYDYTNLPPDQQAAFEKMIQEISISTTTEEVKGAQSVACE